MRIVTKDEEKLDVDLVIDIYGDIVKCPSNKISNYNNAYIIEHESEDEFINKGILDKYIVIKCWDDGANITSYDEWDSYNLFLIKK